MSTQARADRVVALVRPLASLLFVVLAWAALAGSPGPAFAQTQSQPVREPAAPAASLLPTQAERERFHALAEELRCLVCQNQTLADSDAELASDLRREVEELMLAGRNDDEIKAHLVQRYGDFVLYRPPLQRNTWLLWAGPFALLVIGGVVWWRVQRSHGSAGSASKGSGAGRSPPQSAMHPKDAPASTTGAGEASDADLERARRLLE